jgi:NADH-quinone oxidoreductase subunit J
LTLALFYIVAGITIFAAFGVIVARNVVSAALSLLVCLLGIAALFVLLAAEFLALVQILLYGGAIVIVILFALMLTRHHDQSEPTEHRHWPLAVVASGLFLGLMLFVFVRSAGTGPFEHTMPGHASVKDIGMALFQQWAIPFEVASLVLLVALIGAILIASPVSGEKS